MYICMYEYMYIDVKHEWYEAPKQAVDLSKIHQSTKIAEKSSKRKVAIKKARKIQETLQVSSLKKKGILLRTDRKIFTNQKK